MATAIFDRILFRPTAVPSPAMPMGARSVGHYRRSAGAGDPAEIKYFTQVFWSVQGEGKRAIEGGKLSLPPGWITVYFPGEEHVIRCGAAPWEYRWWTMDGPMTEAMTKAFGFMPNQRYFAGKAPIHLFDKLTNHIRDVSQEGEFRAGALAYELLTLAAILARPSHHVRDPAREVSDDFSVKVMKALQESWSDPNFGVEQLATDFGIHRSAFSRRFKALFGISPSLYLQRRRVQNALTLLKETDQSVEKIARACGWRDPNYFSRCIVHATGMSPSSFRRK